MESSRITQFQRIALTAIALLTPLAHAQFLATTSSQAETSAGVGAEGISSQAISGAVPMATSAAVSSSWPVGSGANAFSSLDASASFGALRARGSVRATGENASGTAGAEFAGDPLTAALFNDQVTIGGTGTQTFQLHYALTGFAGKTGPGAMQFAADLGLQAWGAGITIVSGPPPTGISFFPPFIDTFGFSVSGTEPRAIGMSDFLLISATGGSTMSLSGFLGAYLRIDNGAGGGETIGTLDLSNTAAFFIVPVSTGTTFTSASGHNYLTMVPEVGTAAMMLGALPVLGLLVLRRRTRRCD